jgi:hypothetical protein
MKRLGYNKGTTLYDVAPGPIILLLVGIPLLIVIAVVALIIVAVVLIRRARKKNREKANQEK